jgi:hypothetical protein
MSMSSPKFRGNVRRPKRPWWATSLIVGLVVGYVFAKPYLEKRFGHDQPEIGGKPAEPASEPPPSGDAVRTTWSGAADPSVRAGDSTSQVPLGELREVSPRVFESTAGLRYRPGSEEGHRVDHILTHAEDDPDRPGSHGVFDGDRAVILAVIDEAYLKAQRGGRDVKTEREDGRTIHTVNMQKRVGYVGGESGRRRDHPETRHVRLVLEGVDVITAFPVRP